MYTQIFTFVYNLLVSKFKLTDRLNAFPPINKKKHKRSAHIPILDERRQYKVTAGFKIVFFEYMEVTQITHPFTDI